MKSKQAFQAEFPELTDQQRTVLYHYLEVIRPKGASDPEFRRIAANSIDERGNLLKLTYTIDKPLNEPNRAK